jgi:hypothetical protein
MVSAVPHPVTRLVFHIDASFDDFRDRYERAVPTIDLANLVELSAGFGTWDALVERTAELAPHGFAPSCGRLEEPAWLRRFRPWSWRGHTRRQTARRERQ